MNANETLQVIKLLEIGAISRQTFYEKLGLYGDFKQALATLLENRVLSRQTFCEKIGISGEDYWKAEEKNELIQKEKVEEQKISRFDLI